MLLFRHVRKGRKYHHSKYNFIQLWLLTIARSGNAWSQAPTFASPPTTTPEVALSTSLADNSFEAIQIEQLGLSSQHVSTTKKKSMIEIQNEEKEREEEQAFLKWWEEEERRTKEAMGVHMPDKRDRGARGKSRGRGRGGKSQESRQRGNNKGNK